MLLACEMYNCYVLATSTAATITVTVTFSPTSSRAHKKNFFNKLLLRPSLPLLDSFFFFSFFSANIWKVLLHFSCEQTRSCLSQAALEVLDCEYVCSIINRVGLQVQEQKYRK